MQIHVKCYATLRVYQPKDGVVEAEEGESLQDVVQRLGLPLREAKVIFVNGKHASLDQSLRDGDRIAVFPAVGGG
jgi:molybdopterin converting factor small subunit